MEYGTSTNSQLLVNNPANNSNIPLVYYLSKVTDKNGNYYTYDYYNQNGEVTIKEIKYTGNANAGILPYNSVKFYYDIRNDKTTSYFKGNALTKQLILREIEVFCEGISFKKYVPTYEFINNKSFLSSVTEYGANGSKINPTKFSYDNTAYTPSTNLKCWPLGLPTLPSLADYSIGDYNGDGKSDVMAYNYSAIDQNSGIKSYSSCDIYLNQSSGPSNESFYKVINNGCPTGFFIPYSNYGRLNEFNYEAVGTLTGDLNGDGKEDILLITTILGQTTYYTPYYSNFAGTTGSFVAGTQFSLPSESQIKIADIDGDKIPEIIAYGKTTLNVGNLYIYNFATNTKQISQTDPANDANLGGPSSTFKFLEVLDFDQDGTKELLIEIAGKARVIKINGYNKDNNGGNANYFTLSKLGQDDALPAVGTAFYYGDFNGDGITDRVSQSSTGTSMNLRYGISKQDATNFTFYTSPSVSLVNTLPSIQNKNNKVLIADMDNDGKSDIVVLTSSSSSGISMNITYGKNLNTPVFIGNDYAFKTEFPDGIDFTNPPSTFQTDGNKIQEFCLGDFDGNGYIDILFKRKSINQYLGARSIIYNYPINTDGSLSKVTNGFGREVKFNYKTLSDPTIYTKGTGAIYPLIDIMAPIKVVSSVINQDANNNPYSIDYQYEDLKCHLTSKGFLGFGKVTVTDNLQQTKSVTQYNLFNQTDQIPSRLPSTLKTYLLSNLAQPISEKYINYTYVKSFPIYGFSLIHYIKTDNVNEIDNAYGTNSLISYSYDNYNNPVQITTNINSGYQINKTTSTIDYINLYGNKYPSFVTSIATEQTRFGEATINKPQKIKYSYNLINGNLESVIKNVGQTCENTILNSYYTTGSIIKTEENSLGNSPRITNYKYDENYRFTIEITNPLGQIQRKTFQNNFGRETKETDINNLNTNYTYDEFGRNTSITTPDNNTVLFTQKWYNSNDEINNDPYPSINCLIVTEISAKNTPSEKTYITESGLSIKTVKEGFNQNHISNLNSYNDRGLLISSRANYLIPCSDPSKVLLTTKTYDELNRQRINKISDGIEDLITTTNYLPTTSGYNSAIVTYPDGKTKTTTVDPVGLLKTTKDNLNTIINYEYYSDGKPRETSLAGNIVLNNTYDACGNPLTQYEPNYDLSSYTYDGFGQLRTSTNNSKTYSYDYDELGRLKVMNQPGAIVYNYNYKNTNGGKGLIEEEIVSTGASKKYYYDNLSRTTKIEEIINGQVFATQLEYDQYNNPIKYTYPSGFSVKTTYNNLGFQTNIKNAITGTLLWQADEINNFGYYNKYTLGNGNIQSIKTFDNFGFLTNEQAGNIFNHSYNFNKKNGNLNYLNDNIKSLNESFEYNDNLNRLNISTVKDLNTLQPLEQPLILSYDANGNILNKSDVGNYKYHGTKINAVQYIKNDNNLISQVDQVINYNTFEQPENITEGTNTAALTYGVDMERIKVDYNTGTPQAFTRYYLNNYDKEINSTSTREIHYLQAPGGLIGMHVIENGIENTYFAYSDHLGTPKTITNSNGAIVFEQNFDPWGQRRNVNDWSYSNISNPPAWLFRGFTGHEHLPQFNLINMNGRLYDPQNARMLSPDPALQDPTNTQNHNKYSYALNNPLKYTDPSGKYIQFLPIAIFIAGDVLDHQLNRFPGGQYENETVGEAFVNGAKQGYYAYNQVMSMTQFEIANGKLGDFSYSLGIGFSFGIGGLGIGANASSTYRANLNNGHFLDLSVALSSTFNNSSGPSLVKNQTSLAGGFEYGNDEVHGGLYSTTYFSGESSQRVGGISIGGKNWGLNYENDGAIPFSQTKLGDGGDNDRTAALRFRYKEFSGGFNLMTEKRETRTIKGVKQFKTTAGWKDSNKDLDNSFLYDTKPSGRLGGLYFGYQNNYIGFKADGVRRVIQNNIIHNAVGSPHFINVYDCPSLYGGYWPTKKFSLW
jgi:RHS repeat-associated protein